MKRETLRSWGQIGEEIETGVSSRDCQEGLEMGKDYEREQGQKE